MASDASRPESFPRLPDHPMAVGALFPLSAIAPGFIHLGRRIQPLSAGISHLRSKLWRVLS